MPDAWVLAPLVLIAVLVVSAIAKLGRTSDTEAAFRALKVPTALRRTWLAVALPWLEMALAVVLLATWGPLGVLGALAAVALFGGYLFLIGRAVLEPEPVSCNCFGAVVESRVTSLTVVRNAILFGFALVTLAGAIGTSGLGPALFSLGWSGVWWLLGAGLVGTLVWVTLGKRPATPEAEREQQAVEFAEYERLAIPMAMLTDGDGKESTLRELAASQARLLVFMSLGCGACTETAEELPGWIESLPQLGVHPVFSASPEDVAARRPELLAASLFDDRSAASRVLDSKATPSAVLLGTDGLLAGGPVTGPVAIREFVEDIRAELQGVAADTDPVSAPR